MYKTLKTTFSLILLFTLIFTTILPVSGVQGTGYEYQSQNNEVVYQVEGLSPYANITDGVALKEITKNSIVNNKSKGGIKDLLSSSYLKYTGPAGAPKAELTGVVTKYSDRVTVIEPGLLSALNDEEESNDQMAIDNMVKKFKANNQAFESGTILVDERAKRALKLDTVNDQPGTFTYQSPMFHEIFDELTIPEQTVHLKEGNIERIAVPYTKVPASDFMKNALREKGLEPIASPSSTIDYMGMEGTIIASALDEPIGVQSLTNVPTVTADALSEDEIMLQCTFDPGAPLAATTAGGGRIEAYLTGTLAIGGIGVDAKYTGFDGYKFALRIAEEVNVKIAFSAQLDQEVYIPIFGLDVPFGIGRLTAGVFLVAGISGEISVFVEINQGMAISAGVKGPTFCYIPCGFRPALDVEEFYINFDADFKGQVNGTLGAAPCIHAEILGCELVGGELRLGIGIGCAVGEDDFLTIDGDGILYLYFVVLDHRINIVNQRWDIFSRRKRYTGIKNPVRTRRAIDA